jgi:hypothetical protein
MDLSEEDPRALFAQPRHHRAGRFAGAATALVPRRDDPSDLADDYVAVDGDRRLCCADRF